MSEVKSILDEVTAMTAAFEAQRKELVEKLSPKFVDIFKPFFAKYPEVTHMQFTAYTPYFNDGDECTFGVGELYYFLEEDCDEDGECDHEGRGDNYGPSPAMLADFLEHGTIDPYFEQRYGWALQDSSRYNLMTRSYDKFPSKWIGVPIEEYIRQENATELAKGVETLRKEGKILDEFSAIRGCLGSIPDDIIQQLFGDHVKVTIKPTGVDVEEYDHD